MYEEQTFKTIISRMLERIPDDFDKREGSIIYDALAPSAVELEKLYQELDYAMEQINPMTADREHLEYWCKTFGIEPIEATQAIHIAECVFRDEYADRTVEIGSRFSQTINSSGDTLTFVVTEKIDDNRYYLQCEQAGAIGNNAFGTILPIYNVNGLKTARILSLALPGQDVESDDHLLERFILSFVEKAFGGNMADYKKVLMTIQGVGGAKIIRHFEDNDYWVGVIIIDSLYSVPSQETIDYVQEQLHPLLPNYTRVVLENSGDGLVPIGHEVIVEPVREAIVDVELNIEFDSDYTFESMREVITQAIEDYFNETNSTWADEENLYLRGSGIELKLLNMNGIIDCYGTLLNGQAGSIKLGELEIAKLGEVRLGGEDVG